MIFVYITCKDKKEAQKIGQALVKERLAGCVNYWPIESVYHWRGKLAKDKEFVLIVKTLESKLAKVEIKVKKLHSYEVPCIAVLPVAKINKEYLNWLKEEVK